MRGKGAEERTERRRGAHLYGMKAEQVAAFLLRLKGYRILARRFVVTGGEIDLIAKRGGAIAFVEVKARADMETAGYALYGRQFGRVAAAASLYVARHPQYAAHSLRFDAMLVAGLWPRHLPDVWRAPE